MGKALRCSFIFEYVRNLEMGLVSCGICDGSKHQVLCLIPGMLLTELVNAIYITSMCLHTLRKLRFKEKIGL